MSRDVIYILNADTDRQEYQGANLANLIHGELFESPWMETLGVATYNVHQGRFPDPHRMDKPAGIIITGSFVNVRSGQPDSAPWVTELARYLEGFMHDPIPILGVCFGHQILSMIYGHSVEPIGNDADGNPIYEVGYPEITLTEDGRSYALFRGLPRTFRTNESHRNRVVQNTGGQALAYNASGIQAILLDGGFRIGIQFHPEIYLRTAQESLERKIRGLAPSAARRRLEEAHEVMPSEYAQSNNNAAARMYHNWINHYVLAER